MGGGLRTAALLLACAAGIAAPVGAQKGGREERPAVDPYTRGEPEALEKLGYLNFGPFMLGDGHGTRDVATELGGEPILWVETAHFRIGSSLDTYTFKGEAREAGRERKKLHEEIKELSKRLPNVKQRPREIDPWLRLHLWAMRLESLYADFCRDTGVSDKSFEAGDAAGKLVRDQGRGPYLGMRGKFTLLIFERTSAAARYGNTYAGGAAEAAKRHYFQNDDSMLLLLSAEQLGGMDTDVALHCAVVFSMTECFLDGFRGFSHSPPPWLSAGLARRYARAVDPTVQIYTSGSGDAARGEDESEWEPKVRARVQHKYFPTAEQVFGWKDTVSLGFAEHMMAWSRVDFLVRREGPEKMREYLWRLKEPVPWSEPATRDARVAEQMAAAFREVYALDPAAFDAAWSAWVLSTYRK